tara:strand:+ start:434 stop:1024 length:591 start_codon:yes stop_codon:yes gene_type:complete
MSLTFGNMWSKNKKNISIVRNVNNTKKNNKKMVMPVPSRRVRPKGSMGTKSFWGTPTWYLFHSLAEKVDSLKYEKHYMVMWKFIIDICSSLPCPFCKTHAVNYTSVIPTSSINTKEKLITVLFNFHNDVNLRTGKGIQSREVLDKYKNSNLNKILELFNNRFFVSYIGRRHFDDWIKNKTKKQTEIFIDFYNKNLL